MFLFWLSKEIRHQKKTNKPTSFIKKKLQTKEAVFYIIFHWMNVLVCYLRISDWLIFHYHESIDMLLIANFFFMAIRELWLICQLNWLTNYLLCQLNLLFYTWLKNKNSSVRVISMSHTKIFALPIKREKPHVFAYLLIVKWNLWLNHITPNMSIY